MNLSLINIEIGVALLGVLVLLAGLWTPPNRRHLLGFCTALGLTLILALLVKQGVSVNPITDTDSSSGYERDGLAVFFKALFLLAGILVTLITMGFANRLRTGGAEVYALNCFALCGMLFAASANSFVMLFVSIELITITFYVLTSLQSHRLRSLEAGVKYLILGAAASAIMVFGIALIYGSAHTLQFNLIADGLAAGHMKQLLLFQLGALLLLAGLAFKIAAVPFQVWAPDVYQGAPTPVTAFLAIGSKAAGFVLLLRVLYTAFQVQPGGPRLLEPTALLSLMAAATILFGSLCALRQRNLKRLLGYASIASAGYALLGIVALNERGAAAVLVYLAGYLFAIIAAFTVISILTPDDEDEDLSILANLHQRSPLMAVTLTLAVASLAGIPPLAGFIGKFLLLRAVIEPTAMFPWLVGVALLGVVASLYYYFGIIREIFWGTGQWWTEKEPKSARIKLDDSQVVVLLICLLGMLVLGLYPQPLLELATDAVQVLKLEN
jgi:NADH-quinone oxidoreductase subunit N